MMEGMVWLCEVCKDRDCPHQGSHFFHSFCPGFCEYYGDYINKPVKGSWKAVELKEWSLNRAKIHYCETKYGFEYGSAKITRLFSDVSEGWVTIGVATPKQEIQIYVTKTGKIRVHGATGEWLPRKGKN